MTWTLPDKGEGQSDIQSICFQEYLDALVAGINGTECVLVGCAITAQGTPDLTVACAKGAVLTLGVLRAVTAANFTIAAAHATLPRIDLCVIDSTGAKVTRAGTAAAAPKPPARTAGDVTLAAIWVPAADTTISSDQITSLRVLRTQGPILIFKQTTDVVVNNTAAAIHMLNNAGSGVSIPDGLNVAGRILRVRIWGDRLNNSGTPTITFAVAYGGVTLFSDVSGAATAVAVRKPFDLNLMLVSQANADQALGGITNLGLLAAMTAPATGRGDAWSTALAIGSPGGDGTANSDTADRVLAVTLTFSVAAVANEVRIHGATVELM